MRCPLLIPAALAALLALTPVLLAEDLLPFGVIPQTKPATRPVTRPVEPPRTIVYLCDVRRAALPVVAQELRVAVGNLGPADRFNIVFAGAGGTRGAFPGGPRAARREDQQKAMEFLDAVGAAKKDAGKGDARLVDTLAALEMAFKGRPDVVYLLADRPWPDGQAVARKVAALNAGGHVRVNTIAFAPDPGDGPGEEGQTLLRGIARDNGGMFRSVGADDLGK